ncbi:MAG: diaminopimelate epimerase, partial [Nitrospirae bacterium]|nr:diaminopimelate epimerase [Nitrospirota bacterium]
MKKKIPFVKLSGTGNDFIIIDNRKGILNADNIKDFIISVCRRRFSVGADGLILIENSDKADFKWRYFNADGSEAEMCGNGSRCAARFAYVNKIAGKQMSFETKAGIIKAELKGKSVKVQLTQPKDLRLDFNVPIEGANQQACSLNTGVPHVVYFVKDIENTNVFDIGRKTRYHELFQPAGTNANFVKVSGSHKLRIRTYERGVEDETLACGTGSVASALIAGAKGIVTSPVSVLTKGGMTVKVYFDWDGKEF